MPQAEQWRRGDLLRVLSCTCGEVTRVRKWKQNDEMSNANKPIQVPAGVEATLASPSHVKVKGPLGEIELDAPSQLKVQYDEAKRLITLTRDSDDRRSRSLHGLYRTLIANMVEGTCKGFQKAMEIHGTGYSVKLRDERLVLQVGFCHEVVFDIPENIQLEVSQNAAQQDNPARFVIKGIDKRQVGQFAAEIRASRPPEPYKGKGIRYTGEQVRRKEGKALASTQG